MNVWCIKCDRLKPEEEVDLDSRLCVTCRGVEIPPADPAAPLTPEEAATEIQVDIDASASFTIKASEYPPEEWRELLQQIEDKTVDKEELVDGFGWDFYDIFVTARRPK